MLLLNTHGVERRMAQLAETEQIRVSRIGRVHNGEGCILDDRPWPQPAFSHFDAEAS